MVLRTYVSFSVTREKFQRIQDFSFFPNLKMQVRSSRDSCTANQSNNISPFHKIPLFFYIILVMAIVGKITISVVKNYYIPQVVGPSTAAMSIP